MTNAKTGGRARLRKWCRHIRIVSDSYWGDYLFTDKDGWIDWNININRWKFCPRCGTKKPEESKDER